MVQFFAHASGKVAWPPPLRASRKSLVHRRVLATASIFAAVLCLAGCATTEQTPRTATTVPLTDAMIFPPPGGPMLLSVVETNYANAVHQDIALATNARTAGENKISVSRFLGRSGNGNNGELADSPTVDLYAEASAAWPEVSMMVSPFYVQNFYGPFGYAVGGAPTGDTCVYAWQRIVPRGTSNSRGNVVIRLQLCDRASSEQNLLRMMYQMRLRDPVFEPWRASPVIGRAGTPITPRSAQGVANVLDLPEAQPPRSSRPAPVQQVAAPAQPPASAPAPAAVPTPRPAPTATGPIVPLPGGATSDTSGDGATSGGQGVIVPLPPGGGN